MEQRVDLTQASVHIEALIGATRDQNWADWIENQLFDLGWVTMVDVCHYDVEFKVESPSQLMRRLAALEQRVDFILNVMAGKYGKAEDWLEIEDFLKQANTPDEPNFPQIQVDDVGIPDYP